MAPPAPHAPGSWSRYRRHAPASVQQPLEHEVASQMHWPPTQRCPLAQGSEHIAPMIPQC